MGEHYYMYPSGVVRTGPIPGYENTVRRVAVIDPENEEEVTRLADALVDHHSVAYGVESDWLSIQAALRELANPTPPRPDEPQGLGAVVEEHDGTLWVRAPKDGNSVQTEWVSSHSTCQFWDSIDVVRVLSPGVTP